MSTLYPLRFHPLYKRYLWGGRRLETVLGKILPPGDDYAESWEICDHGLDQSVVAKGPLADKTLTGLVKEYGRQFFGRHFPMSQFPLLVKFLDATQTLSVQVHPNDVQAARLNLPDSGKTEAWIVLEATAESRIFTGLKTGVRRDDLEKALQAGRCEDCLHSFHPQIGDCIYLPAGTVHALGAGVLVVEIQQSSDTTYRLFDWNRLGPDGKPRRLHIEQALKVIDYNTGPINPLQTPADNFLGACRLITSDKFVLEQRTFTTECEIGGDERFHVVIVLEGALEIEADPAPVSMVKGVTALLPAEVGLARITPQKESVLLDVFLPD